MARRFALRPRCAASIRKPAIGQVPARVAGVQSSPFAPLNQAGRCAIEPLCSVIIVIVRRSELITMSVSSPPQRRASVCATSFAAVAHNERHELEVPDGALQEWQLQAVRAHALEHAPHHEWRSMVIQQWPRASRGQPGLLRAASRKRRSQELQSRAVLRSARVPITTTRSIPFARLPRATKAMAAISPE